MVHNWQNFCDILTICFDLHKNCEKFQWCKLTLHHRRRSGEDVQGTLNSGHILSSSHVPCPNFLLFLSFPCPPSSCSSSLPFSCCSPSSSAYPLSPPREYVRAPWQCYFLLSLSLSSSLLGFRRKGLFVLVLAIRIKSVVLGRGRSAPWRLYRDRSQTLTVLGLPHSRRRCK